MDRRTATTLSEFAPGNIVERMLSLLNARTGKDAIERHCTFWLGHYAPAWIEAEYNVEKWRYKNQLLEDVKAGDLLLVTGSGGQPQFLPVALACSLTPEEAADHDIQQTAEEMDLQARRDGRAMASRVFAAFITSPYYTQLYRCARCQKFFVNVRSRRNTKYCSTRCAHHDTAVKATREKYQRKRQERLNRINEAIADLATREDRTTLLPNWKQWVADQAEVKVQFLTRLINKEDELARPDWIPPEYWPT